MAQDLTDQTGLLGNREHQALRVNSGYGILSVRAERSRLGDRSPWAGVINVVAVSSSVRQSAVRARTVVRLFTAAGMMDGYTATRG